MLIAVPARILLRAVLRPGLLAGRKHDGLAQAGQPGGELAGQLSEPGAAEQKGDPGIAQQLG